MSVDLSASNPCLYAPSGWTDSSGAAAILEPFLVHPRPFADFTRFEGLGAAQAERLLELLPELNLADRQNNGPRVDELLRAAMAHGGLALSGYLVSAPRWDERVSIDGLFVPALPGLAPPDPLNPRESDRWSELGAALGLDSARGAPDELRALRRASGALCWWLWWD